MKIQEPPSLPSSAFKNGKANAAAGRESPPASFPYAGAAASGDAENTAEKDGLLEPDEADAAAEDGAIEAPVSVSLFADEPDSSAPDSDAVPEPAGDTVLGVRLRAAGQVFFLPSGGFELRPGARAVMENAQGQALGEVVSVMPASAVHHEPDARTVSAAYLEPGAEDEEWKILRPATAQDIARHAENRILAAEASAFCKTCIRQRELDMKLVDVDVLHDRGKIIFYFTAPARIDFRELVKDLVRNYRTRIELRQIGVRHETQMVGGLGNCGMVCCCHSYLRKFAPVTIKMAKEQNLFLNPSKLSGMCGRLLCCLSFEQGNYEEFNRRCPRLGKKYATSQGVLRIVRANLFSQSISVQAETGEELEFGLEAWEALDPRRADPPQPEQQRAQAKAQRDGPEENRERRGREDGRRGQGRPENGPPRRFSHPSGAATPSRYRTEAGPPDGAASSPAAFPADAAEKKPDAPDPSGISGASGDEREEPPPDSR